MPVSQGVFDFETGAREAGFIHIYAYSEVPKNAVVYVGQSVDVQRRHSGHLSGDIEFDRVLHTRPLDFTRKVIDKVRDVPLGPVVTARELELIDHYGTWIELGVGYNRRALMTWHQRAETHFDNSGVTVGFLGGDGPYAAVRRCRRWHKRGDHWNWYPHIVYQLFKTQSEAEQDLAASCRPLRGSRQTESDVDCDSSSHSIVHFFWERTGRKWKHEIIFSQVVSEDEQIPV